MHYFRYENLSGCQPGSPVRLDKEESSHFFRTLRAMPGDRCGLLDGMGRRAEAEAATDRELRILKVETLPPPDAPLLHLYIAPPRRQKMDQILRSATELGIWRIVPMLCERSVSLPDPDAVNGRWKELLFEACKQSGNPYLPQVAAPMRFAAAAADAVRTCETGYFGSVVRCEPPEPGVKPASAAWFVGPEGGFTDAEEQQLRTAGIRPLHFGNWVLRGETAAVCGLCLIQSLQDKEKKP